MSQFRLAASLATQEDSNLANASTSVAAIPSEEDSDEDEEMILVSFSFGKE